MTKELKKFVEAHGALGCPSCEGEGKIGYFCGHEITKDCSMCAGKGIIVSLKTQKQSKKCCICNGRDGGCGGCNSHPKGLIEWESYELI
jgi:hypothetical protein